MAKKNKTDNKVAQVAVSQAKQKKHDNTSTKDNNILFVILVVAFCSAAIAVNIFYKDLALLYRVLVILVLLALGIASFTQTTLGKKTLELARGTRFELRKVTWPTRNETLQTSAMVFVFVLIVSLFLWLIDSVFAKIINLILV